MKSPSPSIGGRLLPTLPALLFLLLLGGAFGPGAAAASIRLALDREVLALGDSATLRITIEGGNGQETAQIPDTPGLRFTRIGSNMNFSFVNGRQNVTAESVYTVTATRVGQYTIGPVQASVAGQVARSDTLALRVVQQNDPAAARSDGLDQVAFLRLQLPDRPVYVGETFVAEIHLYALGGNLKQVPQLQADGFTLGKVVDGGQEGNIRTNNRIYSRARFLQPITAARSGKLQVQASNCILDVQLASRRGGGASDFFEEAFFGLRETKRLTLASAPGTIEVLPLPRTGVPVGFSGAVGEFEIQLSATPTNARAGDPITLRIDLAGKGNFDSVQWTEPPEWKEFRVYPPNATFATEDQLGIEGTKKFEQVVTPESPSITALPAASFSFFSPATRAYRTIRTAAVPLMVAPGAAAPAIPSPTGAGATAAPTQAPPELAPLRHHLGAWTATRATEPSHGLLLALTGLPWIGWLGWRASVQVRRHFGADAVTLRRRALASSIRKGLDSLAGTAQAGDSDAFFTQLFRILQESVALRADLPPAAITEGDLESVLKPHGVGDATLQSLHHLFQRCNDARYAPVRTPADLESVRQETARVVRELTPGT